MEKENQKSLESEIDLFELWKILVKHKIIIFSIIILSMLASLLYVFITKPVYESRAVIRIGQISKDTYVENPAEVIVRVKENYGNEGLLLIEADKTVPNVLVFTARGREPNETQNFLNKIVDEVMAQNKTTYDTVRERQQKRLEDLQQKLDIINDDLVFNTKKVAETDSASVELLNILTLQKTQLAVMHTDLEARVADLQIQMSEINAQASKILTSPTLPKVPVESKKNTIIALGVVAGIMLGIFAAFFTEFLSKARQRSI